MDIERIVEDSLKVFSVQSIRNGPAKKYKGIYISSNTLSKHGIEVPECNSRRPLLLLGGTSIPISDRKEFITFLLESGFEVASIENSIGGPFDIFINPKKERPKSLQDFIDYLESSEKIARIDIAAQSYSAFEVIRMLSSDPLKYKKLIGSIIFINPPGLNDNTGFLRHCFRFLWHHVTKGYYKMSLDLFGIGNSPFVKDKTRKKEFIKREVHGITTWSFKSFRNLVRTFREVNDIVKFKIENPLKVLCNDYNYDINVFLQNEDQVLPVEITLHKIRNLLPAQNIKVVPGGHNDLFFQKWQRCSFLNFLKDVRSRY